MRSILTTIESNTKNMLQFLTGNSSQIQDSLQYHHQLNYRPEPDKPLVEKRHYTLLFLNFSELPLKKQLSTM